MNILIGSRAMAYWGMGNIIRDTTDWDVISDSHIENAEIHPYAKLNNYDFVPYVDLNATIHFGIHTLHVMTPLGLALIKRSHMHRDLSFDKHITHYHKYLKSYMECIGEVDSEVLRTRTLLTMREYPQLHPKLRKTVSEFFDDAVVKKFDHDWLHELFAYNDTPMYQKMQDDRGIAWCSQDKWELFTETEKLQCVSEECCVIAMERFIVPNNGDCIARLAYIKSLNKVCTTLTSGFFRDYAIDNYPKILGLFNQNKFKEVYAVLEKMI